MKVYYDKDADLSLVKGKNVTIVGLNEASQAQHGALSGKRGAAH